jgi:methylmalonyl-CoA/ethylmalonyl-CoA epimerase
MNKGQLRHIAISVPDAAAAAKFYEESFGMERVSESGIAIRLSDGTVNLTLLSFPTDEDAGDERGKDYVGLHHIGVWVDNLDDAQAEIEKNGGKYHAMEGAAPVENAERKFRDPNGVVFDISTHGWDGAKR